MLVSNRGQAECASQSGSERLHLIELYSSEGCNSCPPAEQWVTSLLKHPEIAGLEFHVDYWDSPAWKDPFADHSYTLRQQALAKRGSHDQIYTPQIWVDGQLWKNWPKGAPPTLAESASLSLSVKAVAATPLRATFDAADAGAKDYGAYRLYAAVTENNLSRSVTGGENKGKKLAHDLVVRTLVGPLPLPHADVEFKLPADVNWSQANIVAFIQDERNGSVVQTVRLPLAACQRP